MPIIGSLAGGSSRAFGGLKTFGPPPLVVGANTPMGYVVIAGGTPAIKRFPYTTETYSAALTQTASYGDYANADNSPYGNYKFGTGGNLSTPSYNNQIFRFGFFAETISTLLSTTTYSFFGGGGATNNGVAAYIVGGMLTNATTGVSTSNKMPYSSETPSLLGTTLATARGNFGGVYNANTAAYFTGGTINNGGTQYNIISKMTFSNDTLSTLGATLGTAVAINPTTNSTHASTAGYVFGGYIGPSGQDTAAIQKLLFSNETTSTPSSLGVESRATSVMSKNDTAGYFNRGTNPGNTQKYVYATETISTMGVSDGFDYSHAMNNQGA